jgi:iron complex transport system ATP-binding protein
MYLIRELHVTLSGRTVLQIPHLRLPTYGLLSVIGPNGAGKSTFVRILARLNSHYRGEVTFKDESLHRLVPRGFARMVSFVAQEVDNSCGYSAREVLMMGRYPHKGRYLVGDRCAEELCQRTIENYKLGELLDRRVSELSAGERQKVFIASSVIQETPCIILDEPTSALDFKESDTLFQLLRSEVERERKLVICVTHDLNAALVYSDRILAFQNGGIGFFGSPEECSRLKVIRNIFGNSPLEISHPHKRVMMVIPGFDPVDESALGRRIS